MKARTIIALLALLLAGGAAAWKFIPHTLSYDECSDVYRHFADMQLEGVCITYVQDKVINDTLRLPVTLLNAETDEGWEAIDSLFGHTRHVEEILYELGLPDSVKHEFLETPYSFYTFRAHRETPEKRVKSGDMRSNDLFVFIFINLRCVTIYEPIDAKTMRDAVSNRAIKNQKEME